MHLSIDLPERHSAPASTRRPRVQMVLTAAALGVALALAGFYAYYVMFGNFQSYDDEGFLDISVRHFIQGRPIYDDVFTQYGPFFYVFNGAIFRLVSVPVDTDSVRLLVIGIWIACALLAALFTIRLTGNVPLAVVVLALTAVHLRALADEPGHPGGLCVLLLMIFTATATFFAERRRTLVCGVLGALVGCLLMTKLNIGVFALLALALTLSSTIPGRLAAVARVATSIAILALPATLMRMHIREAWPYHLWAYHYALFATLVVLPVVALHWTKQSVLRLHIRDGVWALIACAAAILVSSTAVAIHGTSLRELVVGPLQQAIKFPAIYQAPAPVNADSVRVARNMLILFLAIQWLRWRWPDGKPLDLALGGVKIAFAVYALYVVYVATPGAPPPVGAHFTGRIALFSVALPFVWLAMVPRTGAAREPRQLLARGLLCGLAAINSLQAYPVAGSQLTFGSALVILAAALCLDDGLSSAAQLLPGWMRGSRLRTAAAGLAVAVLLIAQWNMMSAVRESYRSLTPLDLPGARRMRMSEESVALYRWLALNLRAHADTFIGMPAINSLYFWSEKEPPTYLNPNSWMLLLDDAQQRRVVDSLSRHPRACAVVADRLTDLWMRGRRIENQPLATYISGDFQTVGRFQGYEFRVRKDRSVPELIYCARRVDLPAAPGQQPSWVAQISLPAMKERSVHRMAVMHLRSGRTLADTQPADGVELLQVTGERIGGGDAPLVLGSSDLDLTYPQRLTLRVSPPVFALQAEGLLVRLFDERGELFASLPVVR